MAHPDRFCVYTVLLGGYETLNEQPARAGSAARFLCFTDDPGLRSDSWEIVPVTRLLPSDPVRSQRWLKLLPHRVPQVAAAAWSLYIDNSVILRAPPEELLTECATGCDLALPPHSYRASVAEEFQAVLAAGLDEPGRVLEQYLHTLAEAPEVLSEPPWWCGMLLRRHAAPAVVAAMELWLAQLLRYSRRDQLSVNLAFHRAGLRAQALCIDNFTSRFHSWPHATDRQPAAALPLLGATDGPGVARQWDSLVASVLVPAEVAALRHRLLAAEQSLAAMHASRSWRLTAPLRVLARLLRAGRPARHEAAEALPAAPAGTAD
jgi:hypothetical protein